MAIYSRKEIPSVLKEGDRVDFDFKGPLSYAVGKTALLSMCADEFGALFPEDHIFEMHGLNKWALSNIAYGYYPERHYYGREEDWPCYKHQGFKGATQLVWILLSLELTKEELRSRDEFIHFDGILKEASKKMAKSSWNRMIAYSPQLLSLFTGVDFLDVKPREVFRLMEVPILEPYRGKR